LNDYHVKVDRAVDCLLSRISPPLISSSPFFFFFSSSSSSSSSSLGLTADGRQIVNQARDEVARYKENYGTSMPPSGTTTTTTTTTFTTTTTTSTTIMISPSSSYNIKKEME